MKLATILLAGALSIAPLGAALAQNPGTCDARCETQYTACHASAEALLDECLDRAFNAHEKAACAAAFATREDKCRETEAACLSNCGGS
jgi:hypothetical protein